MSNRKKKKQFLVEVSMELFAEIETARNAVIAKGFRNRNRIMSRNEFTRFAMAILIEKIKKGTLPFSELRLADTEIARVKEWPDEQRKAGGDFHVVDEGSIVLFEPLTDGAREWIGNNIGKDAQWFGKSLVVEHQFVQDVLQGIASEGLEVV